MRFALLSGVNLIPGEYTNVNMAKSGAEEYLARHPNATVTVIQYIKRLHNDSSTTRTLIEENL